MWFCGLFCLFNFSFSVLLLPSNCILNVNIHVICTAYSTSVGAEFFCVFFLEGYGIRPLESPDTAAAKSDQRIVVCYAS